MKATFVLMHQAVPTEIVDEINELAKNYELVDSTVGSQSAELKLNENIRKSKVRWLPVFQDETTKLSNLVLNLFEQSNRQLFGLDIKSFYDMQYTEYFAEDQGFYKNHHDCFMGSSEMFDRKLSMTMQLSDSDDYEGGDFQFADDEIKIDAKKLRDKGSVLIFPSFVTHRVTPVTKGHRKSLVVWMEGPAWR